MKTKRLAVIGAGIVAVIAIGAAAFWFGPWNTPDDDASFDQQGPAATAIRSFASNWQAGTLDKVRFAPSRPDAAAVSALLTGGLGPVKPKVTVSQISPVSSDDTRARGTLDVTWDFGDGRTWTYESSVTAVEVNDTWLVEWTPAVIEPSLRNGESLRVRTVPGTRGKILDAAGSPLSGGSSTVVIGIRKSRTTDPADTARKVAALTNVDAQQLVSKVEAASADQFVEVTRLPRAEYDKIRAEIQPLPGTVFQEEQSDSTAPAGYAKAIIGSVGTATKEDAEKSEGTIREGETTGLSGLEASQNKALGGTTGLVVEATSDQGARTVKNFEGTNGKDIKITLDQKVQTAATEATSGKEHPTSLVAIRVSTGDILAIGNGGGSYNRALLGRYPPGSVFKIPSTYALQTHTDLGPDTMVDCPPTITVGKVFRNSEGSAYGNVPFRTDFAKSCNTAFVGQSKNVTAQQLADTAALLGYRKLDIGLPMFTASVPTDGDATEHAAQFIGQGRVEGNVLNVALTTASIAKGEALEPRLIIDDAKPPAAPKPLDATDVEALRSMMRSVVTDGTGTILGSVAGGEVFAKTGTAEFGTDKPPKTHAWITGYQGDIAFAVVVEGGGFGGSVAGPVAADFLNRLAGG